MTSTVYLIHGDNPALLSLATSEVLETLQSQYPDAELHDISDAPEIDLKQGSLFSDVEIYLHQGAVNTDRTKKFVEYLGNPDPSSILLICVPKPSATLIKAVKQVGGEVVTKQGKNYKETATLLLNQSSLPLTAATKSLITEHIGQDVEHIPGLLDILASAYSDSSRITPQDVQPFLPEKGSIPVWELTDAIDAANPLRALRAIDRMIPANNPIALLAVVTSHVERMFRLSSLGISHETEAAEFLGLKGSTYPAKKALQTLRRYGNSLPALAQLVAQANHDMKGGSPLPPRMSLEILVGRLCTYPRK